MEGAGGQTVGARGGPLLFTTFFLLVNYRTPRGGSKGRDAGPGRRVALCGRVSGGISRLLRGVALRRGVNRVGRLSTQGKISRASTGKRMNSVLGVIAPARIGTVRGTTIRRDHLNVPILVTHSIVRNFGAVFPVPLNRTTAFGPTLMRAKTHVTTVRTATDKIE